MLLRNSESIIGKARAVGGAGPVAYHELRKYVVMILSSASSQIRYPIARAAISTHGTGKWILDGVLLP